MLSQLISTRSKRGINEVGTVWKWLAGTPDHDDLVKNLEFNLLSIPNCSKK